MGNILSIAQTALAAAQAGLATTGHNIANASTPGYSRQLIIQTAIAGQNEGGGFIGKGTQVVTVQRVYSDFLGSQIRGTQANASQLSTYYAEASRINNLLADSSSGVSPVLQDFFASVQNVASNNGDGPSRSAMLSSSQSLAGRLQSMSGQLSQYRDNVNTQITTIVGTINSYSQQIANLNDAISKAQTASSNQPPNDLLDQRDYLVSELSKLTKTTVVKDGINYSVFIGNGQPMVIGPTASKLAAIQAPSDNSQMQIAYVSSGGTVPIADSGLPGGSLGGLLEYRSTTLTDAQNSLGRIAIGIAATFNAQHKLGQDATGVMGTDFFKMADPLVVPNANNAGSAVLTGTISNANALTISDYKVNFDGTNYSVTRISDNAVVYPANATFPSGAIDGFTLNIASGTMSAGDSFVIKPTVNGASAFDVLITDKSKIAAAVPVSTAAPTSNSGTGTISAGTIDSNYTAATITPAVTLTYNSGTGMFSGFPAALPVTVSLNGVTTTYAAGTPVPYTSNATINFGGVSVQISGTPANNDTFKISGNSNSAGDSRNILLLGSLQTAKTLDSGTNSYQDAFAQMVSLIGNKTHELEVNNTAESNLLDSMVDTQQSESGVNLDEEATNLLRYQQAYQAAGKVMQTVDEMFKVLLDL